jgi:hypothetical protein
MGADFGHRHSMRLAENTVREHRMAISIILTSNCSHPQAISDLSLGKPRAFLNQMRRETKTGKHGTVEIFALQEIHPAGMKGGVLGHRSVGIWDWVCGL